LTHKKLKIKWMISTISTDEPAAQAAATHRNPSKNKIETMRLLQECPWRLGRDHQATPGVPVETTGVQCSMRTRSHDERDHTNQA
jgi:hypothetical protein